MSDEPTYILALTINVIVVPLDVMTTIKIISENGNAGRFAYPQFPGSHGACTIASPTFLILGILPFTAVTLEQ